MQQHHFRELKDQLEQAEAERDAWRSNAEGAVEVGQRYQQLYRGEHLQAVAVNQTDFI